MAPISPSFHAVQLERTKSFNLCNWKLFSSSSSFLRTSLRLIELFWIHLLPRDASAERGYEIACRPSVRLSVTIGYRVQIGLNSSIIISRPNSLRPMRSLTPDIGDLVQREHPPNWGWIGVGSGAHKTCHISETVQDMTKVTITD